MEDCSQLYFLLQDCCKHVKSSVQLLDKIQIFFGNLKDKNYRRKRTHKAKSILNFLSWRSFCFVPLFMFYFSSVHFPGNLMILTGIFIQSKKKAKAENTYNNNSNNNNKHVNFKLSSFERFFCFLFIHSPYLFLTHEFYKFYLHNRYLFHGKRYEKKTKSFAEKVLIWNENWFARCHFGSLRGRFSFVLKPKTNQTKINEK